MIKYYYENSEYAIEPYKKNKIHIGISDMACLVLRSGNKLEFLNFGQDDNYSAWYIDDISIKIPNHYHLVASFENWLMIYDDEELMFNERGDFEVYRAGEMGCIIRKVK